MKYPSFFKNLISLYDFQEMSQYSQALCMYTLAFSFTLNFQKKKKKKLKMQNTIYWEALDFVFVNFCFKHTL